jgi:hypothetical protein
LEVEVEGVLESGLELEAEGGAEVGLEEGEEAGLEVGLVVPVPEVLAEPTP